MKGFKTLRPYNFGELPPEMQDKAEKMIADISPLGEVNEGTVDAVEAWSREDVLVLMRAMYNEGIRQPRSIPADVQEAAEKYEEKATEFALRNSSPYEEELYGPAPTYSDAFIAGAEWQLERLKKAAPVADVIEMHGGTSHPFMLSLGFRKMPRIEYHGKPVRVIIKEVEE